MRKCFRKMRKCFRRNEEMFQKNEKMFQKKKLSRKSKHILCSVTIFFDYRAVYDIMWKNIVQRGRPQMTIWR